MFLNPENIHGIRSNDAEPHRSPCRMRRESAVVGADDDPNRFSREAHSVNRQTIV